MDRPTPEAVARALDALGKGDRRAADELVPYFYEELHGLAAACLRRERPDHTLQPTALIHEAYLRLAKQKDLRWEGRSHFMAWAGRIMRQVLVSHARARRAEKRGGGGRKVPLGDVAVSLDEEALDLEALDAALDRLAAQDERKIEIVELRYFGGLTIPEVADVLKLSHATVEREWRFTRAWLRREVAGGAGDGV